MKRIIGIIFICIFVLTGCTEENNYYTDIEKDDIPDIKNAQNIEFIYEYKGHTDNWAAVYIVYKMKDNDNHITKMSLKYIGKKTIPTGKLSYAYDTEGGGSGSGTLPTDQSKSGIYNLGSSGGNGAIAAKDSIVKMQVNWNENTEMMELKPDMN
ncbi:hypothetical protein ACFOLF_26085 [Paenibacillus sepulcri]|uniref:Lipoprotein n=1 Tax=Paenibacillus sepulcri TaxID=359917 RepID=A0ABS7C1L3_9BACL|nr:hypothetical protein [Paenibacillus sepulcri]